MPTHDIAFSMNIAGGDECIVVQGVLRLAPPTRPSDKRPPVMYRHFCLVPRVFFFRVLHTIFSHLRAHAFARSVTVARSSAVQASSSRRQERRWAIVCGSPKSQSTDCGRYRDSPISSSLFLHGPLLCAVG